MLIIQTFLKGKIKVKNHMYVSNLHAQLYIHVEQLMKLKKKNLQNLVQLIFHLKFLLWSVVTLECRYSGMSLLWSVVILIYKFIKT